MFSYSRNCLYILLTTSFQEHRFLSLLQSHLFLFALLFFLWCQIQETIAKTNIKEFTYPVCVLLEVHSFSSYIKSSNHSELTFVNVISLGFTFFLQFSLPERVIFHLLLTQINYATRLHLTYHVMFQFYLCYMESFMSLSQLCLYIFAQHLYV